MTIEKNTIKKLVSEMLKDGKTQQEIEDSFKNALKAKLISVTDYCNAMEIIYK